MKKRTALKSLKLKKESIAKLSGVRGSSGFSVVIITAQRQCLSLAGYYTCETGLHETCDESIRICETVI